ncbi:alpha/beta fold hydrolase [Mycolicibacterium diernhoferi]|uniref:Alpha/beta hydrolase n=2 Tax=Mycolicibacterium diernhoferi TaxID=1801 RepID=A0A1Q4HF23_9MYCO|nr:alpha/beta hydrolase [Mycolicibacterium diernhoferi]OJZ66117.1 alpha/beta hydrolase [Mycolicibacterium diernhoferi]PEG51256.1 alpha/beta hydrolase [Mycolicibacterium diernhoferi]QYL24029.1 alpha/beta hydrolase [Mycolicibacterium diernhoferi]
MRFGESRATLSALLSAVLTAVVAGCAQDGSDGADPHETTRLSYVSAPCPRPNFPGVPESGLGPEFTCGYLTVPENRRVDNGRTIQILVARAEALSDAPAADPIVYLASGPGGAGTLSAPGVIAGGMNADRDVIFVNPRGTVHSDPFLSCPETDEFTARSINLVLARQSTANLAAAAVAACRERLATSGVDFAAYNSLENATDHADLRTALGIKEWNLYGVSYGSDLALQILRDHPDGVRSVVLDSVVPPNINIVDRWWEAPASALAAITRACADQSHCVAAYPDLMQTFTATVDALDRAPAQVTVTDPSGRDVPVTVDGSKLVPLVVDWSRDAARVADIPRMIYAASRGDVTLAAEAIAASDLPAEQRGTLGYGLTLGAYCQEMTNWTTREEALAGARKAMPDLPDAVLRVTPTGSHIFDECRAWGVGRSDPAARQPASSAVPTLILSGTFDASTAPAWVDDVTGGLPNSTVLHFPGSGHGVIPDSSCAQSIMTAFIDEPNPDVDRSCIANIELPALAPA